MVCLFRIDTGSSNSLRSANRCALFHGCSFRSEPGTCYFLSRGRRGRGCCAQRSERKITRLLCVDERVGRDAHFAPKRPVERDDQHGEQRQRGRNRRCGYKVHLEVVKAKQIGEALCQRASIKMIHRITSGICPCTAEFGCSARCRACSGSCLLGSAHAALGEGVTRGSSKTWDYGGG